MPFDQDVLSMWYPNGRQTGTLPSLKDFMKLGEVDVALDMLLNLDAKEVTLSEKLLNGVKHLRLMIQPEVHQCELYGPALASLNSGTFSKEEQLLHLCVRGCQLGMGHTYLSSAIDTLTRAGIEVSIHGYSG
jgi:hypothetical protein